MTNIRLNQDCAITTVKGWYGVKITYQSVVITTDGKSVAHKLPYQRSVVLEPERRLTWGERITALLFGTVCQFDAVCDVPEIHPTAYEMENAK